MILAVYSGIDEGEYKRLSDIAPTVAFPDQPWDTAWDKQMSMIGAALGQPEQAQTLIDETGAYFEKQAADHPQFQGKTATYAMPGCTHPSSRQLGVKTSPGVDAVCTSGDSSVSVGMESIDTLDADVFILVDSRRHQPGQADVLRSVREHDLGVERPSGSSGRNGTTRWLRPLRRC